MFPRRGMLALLLFCVLHSLCWAQQTEEITTVFNEIKTTWSQSAILAVISFSALSCVAIVLVPTVVYQQYIQRKERNSIY